MTDFNLPSIFVPLVGLVFPAIAMASLSLHVQKNKIVQIRWGQISSIYFNTWTWIIIQISFSGIGYGTTCGSLRAQIKKLLLLCMQIHDIWISACILYAVIAVFVLKWISEYLKQKVNVSICMQIYIVGSYEGDVIILYLTNSMNYS